MTNGVARPAGDRGLVISGVILPGTDWIHRDPEAWWIAGERGTRPRGDGPVSLLVGHWTAGAPHEGPTAARRVVRGMRARTRDDGKPMDVGVHLVISWDGIVTQTADLAIGTTHVGSRGWNARSIGVECCWPGSVSQARRLGVDGRGEHVHIAGGRVSVLRPSDAMLAAWVRLAETLAALPESTGVAIPRHVPLDASGDLLRDRMTPARARSWCGAVEHYHAVGTTKVDAGSRLIGALRSAGWRGVIA